MTQVSEIRAYRGPDRRRHCVFVTMNTEYHCRDRICIAVVDRHTGELERDHRALGRTLNGSVRFDAEGISATCAPDMPHVGEQLCFSSGFRDDPHDVVTSTLVRIDRPERGTVAHYPSRTPLPS
jgi:hypothetical protein